MERLRTIAARPDWPVVSGLALGLIGLLEAYIYSGPGDDGPTTILLTLMATVPLIVRRTHLKTAAAVITFATLSLITGAEPTPETAAGIVAQTWVLYLLAERYRGWVAVLLGVALVLLALSTGEPALSNVLLLALGIGALGIGNSRRLGGEVTAVRAERAVMEERTRIARELHDVVAHHVSTIAIQADTARLTTPGMPAEGGEKLEAIGQTARDAMTEMRRVLGVLRDGWRGWRARHRSRGWATSASCWRPRARPGRRYGLCSRARSRRWRPGVELTAYRIIQEALTNARRHAPGAAVEVELRYGDDALRLRVRDEGPGSPETADGHGLLGMRERVAMVNGRLNTGPADGGGFLVEATLPL